MHCFDAKPVKVRGFTVRYLFYGTVKKNNSPPPLKKILVAPLVTNNNKKNFS